MKKTLFGIVLMSLMALTATAQTWDFTTALSAGDLANLQADTKNWSDANGDQTRFSNLTETSGELKANGQIIEWTKGLQFGTYAKDKLRLDPGVRIALNGKNLSVTIPGLKKGQTVTVVCKTGNTSASRGLTVTNLTPTSGSFNSTSLEEQTNVGTVDAAGDVTLTTLEGGMNIFSIKVEGEGSEGGDEPGPDPQPSTFATSMNLAQNQMHLTLQDGDIKYYNTTDVKSVDFADDNITVVPFSSNMSSDEYAGNVTKIGFAKKSEAGSEGEYANEDGKVVINAAKGWLEAAYVTWAPYNDGEKDADSYHVYVKGGQYADYTQIDQPLVRNYGSYGRADAVGLRSGTYTLKVVPVFGETEKAEAANEATTIQVKNYKREGFAFMGGYSPGAYNSDGTLKSGAVVVYVTKNNAKTVTAKLRTGTYTGFQDILKAYETPADNTPLVMRIIGLVDKDDLDRLESKEEGIEMKGKRADHEVNVTIEGIGEDATLRGFGFLVRNCKGLEMRNFGIIRCMDDGISLDTDNSNIWLHHLDVFYGKHGSGDHEKGDGSIDVKADSKLVTVQYCHFWDTGKSNMFGMKSESGPNYISYDHNWFDHSDSRHPRVRTMSVHVWNNFFDNNGKYGVGACTGASVFVENNYFLKTKKPILSSNQGTDALGSGTFSGEDGGMIKAYGNYIDRNIKNFRYYTQKNPASTGYDAYETEIRDEQVPATEKTVAGGTTYNNFDTNASVMYAYTPDDAADVPAVVTGWEGAGRMNHGDIQYTFKDNVGSDDEDSAVDANLEKVIDGYKSALVGIFGGDEIGGGQGGEQGGEGGEQGGEGGEQGGEGGEQGGQTIEAAIECNFENKAPSNSAFTVTDGNYSNSKGEATVNGVTYKICLKMESKTTIQFTTSKDMKMTLVFGNKETKDQNPTIMVGETKLTGADHQIVYDLPAGSHTLTKADSCNLFWIGLE